MEMEEHPPSWRKPGSLPIVRCERPLSHLGAWLALVQHGGNGQCAVVGCCEAYTCCTTGQISW